MIGPFCKAIAWWLPGVCVLLAGCIEFEIESPRDGQSFRAGNPVDFRIKTDDDVEDHTRWFVDGQEQGRGKTLQVALAPGWHQIRAKVQHGRKEKSDEIAVEAVGWEAFPTPFGMSAKTAIFSRTQQDLWIAVPGEGVYRRDIAGAFRLFNTSGGDLPSHDVRALMERGGDVWVATDAGVVRYDGARWETFDARAGLPTGDVRALALDAADGSLWLATAAGLSRYDGASWTHHPLVAGPLNLAVHEGVAWIWTLGRGLLRWEAGSVDTTPGLAPGPGPFPQASPLWLDPTGPRRLWLNTDKGLTLFRDGVWEIHQGESRQPQTLLAVKDLALSPAGDRLWIAGDQLEVRTRGPQGLWRRYDAFGAVAGLRGHWQALAVHPQDGRPWLLADGWLVHLLTDGEQRGRRLDLPDLRSRPPYELGIHLDAAGKRELRLATATENIGDGPLFLAGREQGGVRRAIQQVYRGDRVRDEIHAGELVFHSDPDHNHTHYDGFATYQLREVLPGNRVGRVLRQSAKVSFCLQDLTQIPGWNTPEVYDGCAPDSQGISPGWADIYHYNLNGQSIPIDGIGPGEYWVVQAFTQLLAEKDYRNNTGMTRIRIDAAGNVDVLEEVEGAR